MYFKYATLVRQIISCLRIEDIYKWPIFEYIRGTSTKKEASSLLFEFVKVLEQINASIDLNLLFKSEVCIRRYRSWAKVVFNHTTGYTPYEPRSLQASI